MAKPTTLFTWATAALSRLAPPAGKMAAGWVDDEAPGPKFMNWLLGLCGDWISYLSEGFLRTWWVSPTVGAGVAGYWAGVRTVSDSISFRTSVGGPTRTLVVGSDASGDGQIAFSDDLIGWTGGTLTGLSAGNNPITAVCRRSDGVLVALQGAYGYSWKSTDNGATWTSTSGVGNFTAITCSASLFVIVGANSAIKTSSDGSTWSALKTPPAASKTYTGVFYTGTGWAIIGSNTGANAGAVSTDGSTWTGVSLTTGFTRAHCVAFGMLWALTVGTGLQSSSDGGATWVTVNGVFASSGARAVYESTSAILLMLGSNADGNGAYTLDGTNWTRIPWLGPTTLVALSSDPWRGAFVVFTTVGSNHYCIRSGG